MHIHFAETNHFKCSATSWWSELLPEASPVHLLSRDFAQVHHELTSSVSDLLRTPHSSHSCDNARLYNAEWGGRVWVAEDYLHCLTPALEATGARILNSLYYFTSSKYKSPQQHIDNLNNHFFPSPYRSKIEILPSGEGPKEILSCQPKQCCV